MELSDYIRILRKSWLLVVLATILGIGLAAAYSLTRTTLYEAQSTVFVSSQAGATIAELQQGSNFTQSRVTTYANLVTTPIVMNPVIAELDLGMTSIELSQAVSATSPLNTTLITITVENPDPIIAADIANALGASLTAAVEQIETPNGTETSPVRLTRVKDAVPPLSPSSPNVPLNLALGALVGLAIGIGVAVLRHVLDNRIRTPRDVEQITDRPLIGAIAFDAKAKDRPLIVHADPLSPLAESFRSLRTNLQFLDMGGRSSFVITSSVPSEGKSTTAINLAIALADSGRRVALLDTDLRKPKVADYLGIEGGVGLTDVLIGRARVGDVMLPWGKRSMYVLPAGKIPPNPSELLGSNHMQTLLQVLERDFDVVLCDAPPLLPVTDAAILAKSTSGAIVITSAGRTTRHQLEGALDALRTVDANIAGIVLTMVPTRGPDSYAYGYGYSYGYRSPAAGKKDRARDTSTDASPAVEHARQEQRPAPSQTSIPPRPASLPPASPSAGERAQRMEAAAPHDTQLSAPAPVTNPSRTLDDISNRTGATPQRPDPLG